MGGRCGRASRGSIVVVACASLVLSACGSGSAKPTGGKAASTASTASTAVATANVTMAIPAVTTAGAVLVAQQEGFFQKEHLAVSTQTIANITLLPAALLKGQYDISISTATNLISARAANLQLVAVAGNTVNTTASSTSTVLVAKTSSGITSLKDLSGKRIGVDAPTGNVNIAVEYKLKQLGVTGAQYVTMAYPNMLAELNAGQVDAVEAALPYSAQFAGPAYKSLGAPFLFLPVPNLSAIWIASQSWASAHVAVVARFRSALAMAGAFILAHRSVFDDAVAKLTGLSPASIATQALPVFVSNISPGDFQPWLDAMNVISGNKYSAVQVKELVAP